MSPRQTYNAKTAYSMSRTLIAYEMKDSCRNHCISNTSKNYISSQNKIILILFLLYVSQTFKFLNNKTDYNNHIPRHCHGMGSYTRIYSSSTKWDVIPLLPKDALFPTHFHLSPKFVCTMPQRIYNKTYDISTQ